MARADLPRARKILDTIDDPTGPASFPRPALVPYGLGLMASELAATDPAQARGLLDEAFAGLRKVADRAGRQGHSIPPVSCVMAELLPMVERLEPDRLEERLWLAAACRASLAEQPDMNAVQARRDPGDARLAVRPRDGRRHHRTGPRTFAGAARRFVPAILRQQRVTHQGPRRL